MKLRSGINVILIIFIFMNSRLLFCQEFSLKEAVNYALEHSPNIIISKNKIEKAKVILKDSQRHLDLDISVQFGYGPLTDRRGIGLGISQDLDRLLGGNKKEKTLAQLDLDSAEQDLIIVQQRVIREAIEAFNNLESTKRLLKLKEEAYLDSQKSLDLAQEKFNLGIISLDEFLTKQQTARVLEFDFGGAKKDLENAYLIFYQAIGYKEEKEN